MSHKPFVILKQLCQICYTASGDCLALVSIEMQFSEIVMILMLIRVL